MRVRRMVASFTAMAAVAAGASIALAPGAAAAYLAIDGCQSGSLSLSASDSVVLAFPGYDGPGSPGPICDSSVVGLSEGNTNALSYAQEGYYCYVFGIRDLNDPAFFTVTGGGGLQLSYTPRSQTPATIGSAVLSDGCGGNIPSNTGGGSSNGQEGPSWVQSYGRADNDVMCRDGWDPSYGTWMNQGQGGWVCNRTITYSPSKGVWQVTFTVTP